MRLVWWRSAQLRVGGLLGLLRVHGFKSAFRKGLKDGLHLVGKIIAESNDSGGSVHGLAQKLVVAEDGHKLHNTKLVYLWLEG